MIRPVKMSPEQILHNLNQLDGWVISEDVLYRKFEFKDFSSAWAFMSRIALLAEKMDHHPDWNNIYNTVTIRLSTHDVNGITTLDFELAKAINNLI